MKGKILKYILTPVMVVLNDDGEPTSELQMKPVAHYVGNELDIKKLTAELEKTANDEYFNSQTNRG